MTREAVGEVATLILVGIFFYLILLFLGGPPTP